MLPVEQPAPRVAFQDIRVAVPQAIDTLETDLGRPAEVTEIKVKRFGGTLAFEIALADGSVSLVDALSGVRISIAQPLAENIARAAALRDLENSRHPFGSPVR